MSIADGIMVARFNPEQLGYIGLAEGTLGRLLDILMALLLSGIVLASRAQAAGKPLEAGAVWGRAMWLASASGMAGMAIGFASPFWLTWFDVAPALIEASKPVMVILSASFPAALAAFGTAVFLEAIGRAPAVAVAILAANGLNIVLNYVLISGHLGLPAMGAAGSALSTTLVRLSLALGLAAYLWTLPEHPLLGLRQSLKQVWTRGSAIQYKIGLGAATTAAVMNTLGMGITLLASGLGFIPLAAMTALWNILSMAALFALGIADATALRVAETQGQRAIRKPADTAVSICGLGLTMALVTLFLFACPLFLAPELVAELYASGPMLHAELTRLLPLGAFILICDGATFVFAAVLRGLNDIAWPMAIGIFAGGALLPLAWWLAFHRDGGALGLAQAILAAGVVRTVLFGCRFCWRAKADPAMCQRLIPQQQP